MNTKILLMLVTAIFFYSCNDEVLKTTETSAQVFEVIEPITDGIYPYSLFAKTRSATIPNWEEWQKVRLSSGVIGQDSVAVPWANTIVSSNIPAQVRRDIKAENGWMLLKYTVNGNWGNNNNYMFFYNKYTGVLKVFYYLSNGAAQSNYGIWHLHIDVPQKLFAFTGEIADPINGIYQTQDLYCTNITSTDAKGFVQGWNCFQVELAYDPQFINGELTVNPVSRTSSEIKLTGSFSSSSKGTIVTTTSSNPTSGPIKGLAKAAGDEALSFLKKEAQDGKFATKVSNAAGDIVKGGVSAIVKGGINQLFSSFIGRFNKEQALNYDLQFTTNGTAEISGTINTEITGGLVPANLNLSKSALGITLGVWNLSEQPTIYFMTTAKLLSWGEHKPTIFHLWKMQGDQLQGTNYKYDYVINPDIINCLSSYNCNLRCYSTDPLPKEVENYPHGSLAEGSKFSITSGKGNLIYENYYEITNYYDKFQIETPKQTGPEPVTIPRILFIPNAKHVNLYGNAGINYNTLIKATTTLYVNNNVNDTIVLTKTFAPKLEWNPKDFKFNKEMCGNISYTVTSY